MQKRRVLSLFTVLVLLAMPYVLYTQRYNAYDWYRLSGYTPPDKVMELATETTMQPSMRRLFYVFRPSLEDKGSFNSHCRSDEKTIVLGCYIDRQGIYLLDVKDSRLDGVEQVTAAHETLHAAYARLGSDEKKKIDAMTNAAFLGLTDQRVKDNIELYRKQNPAIVPNELHSILGTEVRILSVDLENYYRRYFTDRGRVVSFSEQYEKAFTERKNQVAAYDAQLVAMSQQIKALQSSLEAQTEALQNERNRMDALRSSDQISAYNAAVPGYNAKVKNYNQTIDSLSALVEKYNEIVPKRNAVASEEEELVKSIDSRATVPARQ